LQNLHCYIIFWQKKLSYWQLQLVFFGLALSNSTLSLKAYAIFGNTLQYGSFVNE